MTEFNAEIKLVTEVIGRELKQDRKVTKRLVALGGQDHP